ncbi:hypothetical protein [Halostagnicola sp. A-GB9-2]|uniref:hypothetical protein n=1 Tax=Halostagnicola sp. A-GB9-2 TaxID=3048066 RepID=UPI0024C05307|nr:hypothetical protein [Halostagnicola sp. A-GB9-2]MDJ1434778.1 hypothetical protein [Halostagnicola sp. A-GB9-2]
MSNDYRTEVEHVRLELESETFPIDELSDTQVEIVGIEPAHLDVEELLADTGMSDDRLALIERYLAGHHLQASGVDEIREVDSETQSDGSSTQFAQPDDRDGGYDETTLGRKAISKDTSKTLENIDKPPAVIRTPDARGPKRSRSLR